MYIINTNIFTNDLRIKHHIDFLLRFTAFKHLINNILVTQNIIKIIQNSNIKSSSMSQTTNTIFINCDVTVNAVIYRRLIFELINLTYCAQFKYQKFLVVHNQISFDRYVENIEKIEYNNLHIANAYIQLMNKQYKYTYISSYIIPNFIDHLKFQKKSKHNNNLYNYIKSIQFQKYSELNHSIVSNINAIDK